MDSDVPFEPHLSPTAHSSQGRWENTRAMNEQNEQNEQCKQNQQRQPSCLDKADHEDAFPAQDHTGMEKNDSSGDRPAVGAVRVRSHDEQGYNTRKSTLEHKGSSIYELFRPPGRGALWLPFSTLVISIALLAIAVAFQEPIQRVTQVNAGLFLGSLGTLLMCSAIFIWYIWSRWYRRHMHILLLNMAVCEFLLALTFVLGPVWKVLGAGVGPNLSCSWLSVIREYLIMCATVWTICMAWDLYLLMSDPFTSPRSNRRKYWVVSHSLAFVGAIVMAIWDTFQAPVSVGNFCWVGASSENADSGSYGSVGVGLFIIAPVSVSMAINMFVAFISFGRFRDGLAATLKNRHELLREGFLTTVTLVVYGALVWGTYSAYWVTSSTEAAEMLSLLFSFLLSYRGSVSFVLWCLYKQPMSAIVLDARRRRTGTSDSAYSRASTAMTGFSSGDSARSNSPNLTEITEEEWDDVMRPQMNLALLEELVYYTTHGIAKALCMASTHPVAQAMASYSFTLRPPLNPDTPALSCKGCNFTEFHPLAFLKIRRFFDIDDEVFLQSLESCTMPKVSEGASGSFMFYSKDRSYIVKSLTAHESNFLHGLLEAYSAYIMDHPETFITRFLGSYCIVLYGKKTHFVVMENVFDTPHGISIHQRYDIKGSWVDRNAERIKTGSEATCRHCNMTFRCGIGRNICPNRAGAHEPNVVLKDMDLTTKLRFGRAEGKKLIQQLRKDSDFLCDQGIMDYSLLLGVIEVSYQVNQQNILTRDGSVFLSSLHDSMHEGQSRVPNRSQRKQSTMCLRTSEVVVGPGFYYIGIIDILQTWDFAKRLERFIKTVILRKDPDGISALPPKAYKMRFQKKLDEIVHLGHNYVATPQNAMSKASSKKHTFFPASPEAADDIELVEDHHSTEEKTSEEIAELVHQTAGMDDFSATTPAAPWGPQGQVRQSTMFCR